MRNYLARTARASLLKGKVKWVPAEQLHVTLVFAGDVDDDVVAELRGAVEAARLEPLSFSLAGLGRFPPRGEPRVLWAGLAGDVDPLLRLQAGLAERAAAAGVELDKRPFAPHVTLGRVKSSFGAYAVVDEIERLGPTLRDKPFSATALTLYASELTPAGSVYTPLLRRAIAAPTTD
ncbi:MAG: RNA 2',3'-cyclic phosphodiesterase [Planctomycetes bacterium]|nr:RNA 2',3'-cyclic phosphodiesterase [Planctomycetota bacterium]